jgi:hypothetical protein
MAEAAAYNEAVSGKSNPLGKESGKEPGGSKLRSKGNMVKAPKGQVEPGEPAPGNDEPDDWESFFNGTGGPSVPSKRKVERDIKESLLIEAERAIEEGTLEEFLSDTADVLVEAVLDNQVLAEALEDARTENERLSCKVAFADFTRGCSNFHREKMASFMDDVGTWHMARDFQYLQKVSDTVKQAGNRLKKGVNGQDPFWADCDKAPEGAAQVSVGGHRIHDSDRMREEREMEQIIQAIRKGPLGTRQA